jgi:RNA polymerase sigma-70 factor (ECF subfamily)
MADDAPKKFQNFLLRSGSSVSLFRLSRKTPVLGDLESGSYEPEPEKFRTRLKILAATLIPRRLQARFDASDVVQEALLKAHRELHQFGGESDAELLAWLQKILRSAFLDKCREHQAGKREAGLDVSLQQTLDESFARLEKLMAADSTSPSDRVKGPELIVKALDALASLPLEERDVVVAYYLHGLTQQEIAETLGTSKASVARTIVRALGKLRAAFKQEMVS